MSLLKVHFLITNCTPSYLGKKVLYTDLCKKNNHTMNTLINLLLALMYFSIGYSQSFSTTFNFDASNDLTNNFNNDGTPIFTQPLTGGLVNSGMISIPFGSQDLWTCKSAYDICNLIGDTYIISSYFRTVQNSGYGGIGFAVNSSNVCNSPGYTSTGLGVTFHGGGCAFHNNGTTTWLDWFSTNGDLVPNNWYKFVFTIQVSGVNTYNLLLQIYNSDANGTVGSLFVQRSLSGVSNSSFGNAPAVYPYFSAVDYRMDTMDKLFISFNCAIPLPIILSEFNYSCDSDNTGTLNWQLEQNPDLAYYDLETSTDLEEFTLLKRFYSNNDLKVSFPISEYAAKYARLSFKTIDGELSHSDAIGIKTCELTNELPCTIFYEDNKLVISSEQNIEIKIYDLTGKLIHEGGASKYHQLVTYDFPNGMLILHVKNDKGETRYEPLFLK